MDQITLAICKDAVDDWSRSLKDALTTVTDDAMRLEHLFNVLIKKGVITQAEFDEGWEQRLLWGEPTPRSSRELGRLYGFQKEDNSPTV